VCAVAGATSGSEVWVTGRRVPEMRPFRLAAGRNRSAIWRVDGATPRVLGCFPPRPRRFWLLHAQFCSAEALPCTNPSNEWQPPDPMRRSLGGARRSRRWIPPAAPHGRRGA
jgi:hypothetical protein